MVDDKSDALGRSLAKNGLVVPVEIMARGQTVSNPSAELLLSRVTYLSSVYFTFSNRKSWLPEICGSHSL